MNKLLYVSFAALAGIAMTSCSSEEMIESGANTAKVPMRVELSYPGVGQNTRTQLTEISPEEGQALASLKCTWEKGDVVAVFTEAGNYLGDLTPTEGVGTDHALFDGILTGLDVNTPQQNFHFIYVPGAEANAEKPASFDFDYATQTGAAANLSDKDYLRATTQVEVSATGAYAEDMGLSRDLAFAHFKLNFPVEYNNEQITVETGQYTNMSVSYTNELTATGNGDITVNTNDMYLAIPVKEAAEISFVATIDEVTYVGKLNGAHNWKVNEFINAGYQNGVPVTIEMEQAVNYKVDYVLVGEDGNALDGFANPYRTAQKAVKALTLDFTVGSDFEGNAIDFDLNNIYSGGASIVKIYAEGDAGKTDVKGEAKTLTNKAPTATYYVMVKQNTYSVGIIDASITNGKKYYEDNVTLPHTLQTADLNPTEKEGYKFLGWSLTEGGTTAVATVEFTAADMANAEDIGGTKVIKKNLYPIWQKLSGAGTGGEIIGGGW